MRGFRLVFWAVAGLVVLAGCDDPIGAGDAAPEGERSGAYVGAPAGLDAEGVAGGVALRSEVAAPLTTHGIDEYASRGAFDGAAPGLPIEDFEDTRVAEGSAASCEGPFDSATDNACFGPGAILPGISMVAVEFGFFAVLRPPVAGVGSTVTGPDGFGSSLELVFPGEGVTAVGLDLLAPAGGPAPIDVEVFGTDDSPLGSSVAQSGETSGVFWGIVSPVPVGRILLSPGEGVGLLVDDIAFGTLDAGEEPIELAMAVQQEAINPRSRGVTPVAVFSHDEFDASTIEPATVRFGPGEAMPTAAGLKLEDVDGDGLADAVLHFRTRDTGLTCGDSEVVLVGETVDGEAFEAAADVRVLCVPSAGGRGRE